MKVLLIEPKKSKKYHTNYPPLGLLKISAYHKSKNDEVKYIQGFINNGYNPDRIYITSLFTYAYEPVHDVIGDCLLGDAEILVGGIYATLCREHLKNTFGDRITIHSGLFEEAEDLLPDYSLVPEWDRSILFASRGCIRNCPFCAVKRLEPKYIAKKTIKHLIDPKHKKVTLFDNNILASPYWENIFDELEKAKVEVDFNQGLDARLIDTHIAKRLKRLKLPLIRLAYDILGIERDLKKAIDILKEAGFNGRRIMVYCLFNNPYDNDNPETFLKRIKDLLNWGVVSYPMKYEPLEAREKNSYISPYWTADEIEIVAKARRVLGYGGSFPPIELLKNKILNAKDFNIAFEL